MNKTSVIFTSILLVGFLLGFHPGLQAQMPGQSEKYLTPPDPVANEVLAPRHKNITLDDLSPDRRYFLNRVKAGISPLKYFAKPFYNLAGLQIDYQANRSRSLTIQQATIDLELIEARTGEKLEVETPGNITITHPQWSPDGSKLAWFGHSDEETHLYVTDLNTRRSTRITEQPVLAALNTTFQWSADGRYILTVLIPEDRGKEPTPPPVADELQVSITSEKENRLRTYPSLLESNYEAKLLEYYITGQLVRIDLWEDETEHIGEPSLIRRINADPTGDYVIVRTLPKPFSRIVPRSRFAWKEEIWDTEGNILADLRESESREGIPGHQELEDHGRKNIQWRPDGKGLSLLLDPDAENDEDKEEKEENSEKQDDSKPAHQVIQWLPPFGEDDMEVIYESKQKLRSISYSETAGTLFLTKRKSGKEHLYAVFTDEPDSSYTIYRYDRGEFYENPGGLMQTSGSMGISVVRMTDDGYVYLSGTEYFEDFETEAPRPFIDRVEVRSGKKVRIFQSEEEVYEQITAVLDDRNEPAREIMLERQSADMHPNSWLHDIQTGDKTKLTDNTDYNEAVTGAQRERFKVERADSLNFWIEVILPRDWDGEPMPGLIWHYPREYDDQEDYDESQRRYNKNRYPTVGTRTPEILVRQGYAVIRSDWPITGDRGASNDSFVWSVVQNSTSVIDSAEARGYIDREQLAIGGHSYGAFGTANAMIHTSFFKAGIAGDGNFNRTLTPIGFQSERSDLWRGQDRYLQMSPIFWADRLDGALLMYHGEEDQNVGTWPTNSRRMFHALNGIGKTAAMYMYPYEGHSPAAEETLLDLWRRWIDWLDHYVKGKEDPASEEL